MTKKIVTRFAPSPTGFLHIGGARTALFNWLLAKHDGGECLLRIEDTDKARSTQEATDALLKGLKWMELDFDGETVFQSHNIKRHVEVAQQLIAEGKAYYCCCTPEELTAMRDEQKAKGGHMGYNGKCRDAGHTEGVVRIKSPQKTNQADSMIIDDAVQDVVNVKLEQLDDMILLRADGTPTYMLSVVVDDHDMGVTHIVRGDDHLNNAFRQSVIYYAMEWGIPVFAHIPLIHGTDGAKLSKRHGATGLDQYEEMGYLPAAMRNYLLRLGWGHGDTEIISTEDAIKLFELKDIGKSPSCMDSAKLNNVNAHYIRSMPEYELLNSVIPFIEKKLGNVIDDKGKELLKAGLHDLKERASTLVELADEGLFYVKPTPLKLDKKALAIMDYEAKEILKELVGIFTTMQDFTADNIKQTIKDLGKSKKLKMGAIAMPLRAALTGKTSSPSIFNVAEILGKQEVISRVDAVASS